MRIILLHKLLLTGFSGTDIILVSMNDSKIIKISLVLSCEDNVVEYHRILPENYFNGRRIDLFSKELDSLRAEARSQEPDFDQYEEYVRIAAVDPDTGKVTPSIERPG